MNLVLQDLTNKPQRWFVLIAILGLFTSCVNNRNLADLDLGDGRQIKIYSGWADPNLPIYSELFINGRSVGVSVVEYEERLNASVLDQYRYNVFSDDSRKIFVVTLSAPDRETRPIIALDFEHDFGYPVCPKENCLDCHGGYCGGNDRACFTKFNQILNVIENENPGIKLKRIEFDDGPVSGCSK